MPTATADRTWRWLVALPVVAAVALGGFVALGDRSGGSPGGSSGEAGETPLPVAAASIYEFEDLGEMVEASELVVRGHVVTTARGRVVGEGESAVISRLITLQIDEVLAGTAAAPTVPTVLPVALTTGLCTSVVVSVQVTPLL